MARAVEKKSAAEENVAGLQAVLGHTFRRVELLTLAVTHRSYVYDKASTLAGGDLAHPEHDNEQLEFMGDAVLGLLVAEALCEYFPASREGELTRLRATLVSRKHLGEVGARLDLGRWLRLGHTAEKNNGRKNTALFANAMEGSDRSALSGCGTRSRATLRHARGSGRHPRRFRAIDRGRDDRRAL